MRVFVKGSITLVFFSGWQLVERAGLTEKAFVSVNQRP